MVRPLDVAYLGNFGPSYSTESHIAGSLEGLGHRVRRVQEGEVRAVDVPAAASGADLTIWTQTYGLAASGGTLEERTEMVAKLRVAAPTISVHLDRWWGLEREEQVSVEPFFRTDRVFTADGDNDDRWAAAGVAHRWMPPAVFGPECVPGTPRPEFVSDVAFVGAWRHYGHDAWWPARRDLLAWLNSAYPRRVRFWPTGSAVRGRDLNDLYASAKVIVGDSCFADRSRRYISDRVFETVGRGGFLVMPCVDDVAELLADGEHMAWYCHGDYDGLRLVIDRWLSDDAGRERVRAAGQAHVAAHHTYAHRLAAVIDTVNAELGCGW